VPYKSLDRIQELRDYAEGRQDYTKYMDILLGPKPKDGGIREGFMNCDFPTIFSPAPMIVNKLVGILEGTEHDILVDSIDEAASFEKNKAKEKLWLKKQFKPELDQIAQQLGYPQDEEQLPESREELDLMGEMGVTKLPFEMYMEKCLGHTFDISDHPDINADLPTMV